MYELKLRVHFDGAHFLRNYEGKCANIHGHRWEVDVVVEGPKLDNRGILIDFHDLKHLLKEIAERFDHKLINEVEGFKMEQLNPTAENMARFICEELEREFIIHREIRVKSVTVWESPFAGATYTAFKEA